MDEVKALILESYQVWKNYKKRVPSRHSQGTRAQKRTRDEECLLSTLET